MKQEENQLSERVIISKIYFIRGQKVMLDRDLAALYGVTTGNLNKAVRRNPARFPEDFMFQLTREEHNNLIFQNGISNWGGVRKLPFAFTESGVAMLSSVLKSETAIEVNICIIRIFVKLRLMLSMQAELMVRVEQLEKQVVLHSEEIRAVFDALKHLLLHPQTPPRPIGFKIKTGDEG